MPVLEREFAGKKSWFTKNEILEYMTIAQVTPGIVAVNICTFIGIKRAGLAGGVLATTGFILPGVSLIAAAAVGVRSFTQTPAAGHAFAGIKLASCALIVSAVFKTISSIFQKTATARRNAVLLGLCVMAFILQAFFDVNPVLIIFAAALPGVFLFWKRKL